MIPVFWRRWISEFKPAWSIESSRTVKDIQRNPALKNRKQNKNLISVIVAKPSIFWLKPIQDWRVTIIPNLKSERPKFKFVCFFFKSITGNTQKVVTSTLRKKGILKSVKGH